MAKKVEKVEEEVKEVKKETVKKEEPVKSAGTKKSLAGYIFVAVALIVVFIVVFVFTNGKVGGSQEDKLSKSLTKMGEEFYTEFYYKQISQNKSAAEVAENLEKFKDIGIKINLDNLARYKDGANKEEIAKFKNSNGKECNVQSTRAIIYPKSPYGKNDYTVKVELDCGFASEATK